MNIEPLVLFVGGGSLAASVLLGAMKSALNAVPERYGPLAKQLVLLVICVAIASIMAVSPLLPEVVLKYAWLIFTGAVALYEVFVKAVWQKAVKNKV